MSSWMGRRINQRFGDHEIQPHVPWSKVAILGMVIPPLIGILIMGIYINPYYWVDDHPLLYGNNGSLDPGSHESAFTLNRNPGTIWLISLC